MAGHRKYTGGHEDFCHVSCLVKQMSVHTDLLDHFKSETPDHKTGRLRTKASSDVAPTMVEGLEASPMASVYLS